MGVAPYAGPDYDNRNESSRNAPMFDNMTIRARITLAFALVFLVFLGASALSIERLIALNGAAQDIRTNSLPSVESVSALQFLTAKYRSLESRHIAAEDQAIMRRLERDLNDVAQQIRQSQQEFAAQVNNAEERQLIQKFNRLWGDILTESTVIQEISRANRNNEAVERIIATHGRVDEMNAVLGRLIEIQNEQAREQGERADNIERSTVRGLILANLGVALFVVLTIIALHRVVSRRIDRVSAAMRRLADGDVETAIPYADRKDEVGEMARMVEVFRANARDKQRLESEQVEQRAAFERAREQQEQALDRSVASILRAAASGDLARRIDTTGMSGAMERLGVGVNQLVETIERTLGDLGAVLASLADGQLTARMEQDYQGLFATLKSDANMMAERLSSVVGQIDTAARALSDASSAISTGSADLETRTVRQAASIEETSTAMRQLTASVRQNADNASDATRMAGQAREAADKGAADVAAAIAAMREIETESRRISDIVTLIDDIAFETHLLALNAGVEAARAGDAGKGFAVVAGEVRALARRAGEASKEVKKLIDDSRERVEQGGKLVNETSAGLAGIVQAVNRLADHVKAIAQASEEQANGLAEINQAIANMDEVTHRNSALVEQTAASARGLTSQAEELQRLVGFFDRGDATLIEAPRAAPKLTHRRGDRRDRRDRITEAQDDWRNF
jgi:methyl-accepting chemotaxis protein